MLVLLKWEHPQNSSAGIMQHLPECFLTLIKIYEIILKCIRSYKEYLEYVEKEQN